MELFSVNLLHINLEGFHYLTPVPIGFLVVNCENLNSDK